ncbi:MAG TPA: TraB/GumN family protein [Sphingomicrobium sp.]|nr:TraB/GumN family protein [Sphingomicrobium sp.]
MSKYRRLAAFAFAPALFLAGLASAAAPAVPRLPDAEPAMWMVKDADTTIYLFGTFHALDGKTDWFNDEVRQAFDASQDVVLEIITPDDPAAMRPVFMRHAIDKSGRTLTSKLSPRGRTALAAALQKHKMPANALDQFKPFFASLTLATLQFSKLGMGAEHGSEEIIKKAVKGTTKKLGAVETVDEQMGMLDALPEAEQIKLLESALAETETMGPEIASMLAAWNRGDAAAVAKMIRQSDAESPSLHKVMFTDRNARWTQWVNRRLASPGTVFMAVGAGHLAGDSTSLVAMLKRQGRRVTRVQ